MFRCVVEGVGGALPDSELLVYDNGLGRREESTVLESGAPYRYTRLGARGGKRYYLPENLATASAFVSLGRTLGALHPMVRELDGCDAVLDVSGGDSFSDIYGSHRFSLIVRPKLIAAKRGIPLVLLPQTYGPFEGREARELARQAVLGARIAWARDPYSFDALQELGVPTRFIKFPRQKHGIEEPRLRRVRFVEEIRWMQKWILGLDWSPPLRSEPDS